MPKELKELGESREASPTRAGAVWALVVTSVAGFMASLDNLVVTTALPSSPSATQSALFSAG